MKEVEISSSIVVVGGGLAGVCAAIEAARMGHDTLLIQNRPVFGGNSSSEIRVWTRGATGGGNLYSEEMGILGELKTRNLYVNKDFNVVYWDAVLLDAVMQQQNLRFLLNTNIDSISTKSNRILNISGTQQGSEIHYCIKGNYYIDATGDGTIGAMAGVPYEIGDKKYCGNDDSLRLMSSSILYYSVDTGKPVNFIAPEFAYDIPYIDNLVNHGGRIINEKMTGCDCWWCEFGGLKNTINDSQDIFIELQKLLYGIWNYVKNSGKYPNAENYTLSWAGVVPGKRESRRFYCDYMLTKKDVLEGREFKDNAFYGGWYLDTHPAEGIRSEEDNCEQIPVNVYSIPFRSLFNRDFSNLLFAGRIIGTEHDAFASTRLMNTCALSGQAAGVLAAQCDSVKCDPKMVVDNQIDILTRNLLREDMFILNRKISDDSLGEKVRVEASSTLKYRSEKSGKYIPLKRDCFISLPINHAKNIILSIDNRQNTSKNITIQISKSNLPNRFVDKNIVSNYVKEIKPGQQELSVYIPEEVTNCFCVLRFQHTEGVYVELNKYEQPGILIGEKYSEKFYNPYLMIEDVNQYLPENIVNGYIRPFSQMNLWSAESSDPSWITLSWPGTISIREIRIYLDPDLCHEIPSSVAERFDESHIFEKRCMMPEHLIKNMRVQVERREGEPWSTIAEINNNWRRMCVITLPKIIQISKLKVLIDSTWGKEAHICQISVFKDAISKGEEL